MFRIRLKELREQFHLSQAALAKKIGVSQSAVGMWESGRNMPESTKLEALATLFDVSTDYLLGRDVAEEQPKPAVPDIEAAKVALFGGDGEVTDEMWEEALFAAQLIKERHRRKNDQ